MAMKSLIPSIRLVIVTLLVGVAGYTALLLAVAQIFTPETAQGSLIRQPNGRIIGSRLIAQGFSSPTYFWPRPSAVGYNAAGAGGSNRSPTSHPLSERAQSWITLHGASHINPLPVDLAAASGSGLDPHITEQAALFQAVRVARERHLPISRVSELIQARTFAPGGSLTPDRLVNVLELNISLDSLSPR
jgi:K+-transporting ATPase ATPase C chain